VSADCGSREKIAGSSPVSHPSEDPGKPSMIAVAQILACPTAPYDRSSEAGKVEARAVRISARVDRTLGVRAFEATEPQLLDEGRGHHRGWEGQQCSQEPEGGA
jgi:hypothetical protein